MAMTSMTPEQLSKPLPIWKTIQIGGKSKDELITELEAQGFEVSDWTRDMMDKEEFTTLSEPVELQLVRVKVAELGFKEGATTKEIWQRAQDRGLELCPAEVGPHLRLQYPDQPKGEYFWIGMEQIVASGGYSSVFPVGHDGHGRWLRGFVAHSEFAWDPGSGFVFVLPSA